MYGFKRYPRVGYAPRGGAVYPKRAGGNERKKGGFGRKKGVLPRRDGTDKSEGQRKYATTSVMRGPNGFPDRIQVKLAYYVSVTYTNTGGISGLQQFRGNSLFDPDLTATGHQPLGFDQWANLYGSYRVHGSSIRLISLVAGATDFIGTAQTSVHSVMFPTLDTAGLTQQEVAEQPYTVIDTGTFYQPLRNQRNYITTAKISGVNNEAVEDNTQYAAAVTANPSQQWYWTCYVIPASGGSGTSYWTAAYKLTYYAEFFARKQLTSS